MSGLLEPPSHSPGGLDTCEGCGFLLFSLDEHPLICADCGKGPLCWDCYETHAPREDGS